MIVSIANAVAATSIFIALFLAASLLSIRRNQTCDNPFPCSLTRELKGFAVLAIVFSHIGYFLVNDTRFLFPMTILAGVGVNLFLFLSGFGLTTSSSKKEESILQSYRGRLSKLMIPFWLTLILFFWLDFFVLKHGYSTSYVIRSFLGFFPQADLYQDINAPFWYFTLILFYYLIFPLVFSKKRPWLSAIIITAISALVLIIQPTPIQGIIHMYRVHIVAFPLGMIVAWLLSKPEAVWAWTARFKASFGRFWTASRLAILLILLAIIVYTANYYSGVGKGPAIEELISLLTMSAVILLFALKNFEIRLWSLFGVYSYEIYLLHWPIMYHYDIFYRFLPPWLATSAYLALFIGLGWLLRQLTNAIIGKLQPKAPAIAKTA